MWRNILWLALLVNLSNTIFVVEVNKLFKPCPNAKPSVFPWNVSELQLFLSDNDELTLNGRFVVAKDIYPPLGLNMYTHKQEHGDWMPTPYSKQVLNLCGMMLSKHEMWYAITQHLNKSRCPFRKGHVESFDMVTIGNFGFEDVLPDLVGEWRIFIETTLGTVPHLMDIACTMCEVSIIEH